MVRAHVDITISGFTKSEPWTVRELQKLIDDHPPFIGMNLKVTRVLVGFYDEDGNDTLGQDLDEQPPWAVRELEMLSDRHESNGCNGSQENPSEDRS